MYDWRDWILLVTILVTGAIGFLTRDASGQIRYKAEDVYFDSGGTLENAIGGTYDLVDYDGDGSVYETCTGKDSDSAGTCKTSGYDVNNDTSDDLNALLLAHPGELVHVKLRCGVAYRFRPCWDAANPTENDEPGDHDADTDDSHDDCVDDEYGAPLYTVAIRGRKLKLEGCGTDERLNDTSIMAARGTGLDRGTHLILDNGNHYDAWYDDVQSGNPMFITGIRQANVSETYGKTGTSALAGGSKGYWWMTEDEDLATAVHAGSVCLCNDAGSGNCSPLSGVKSSGTDTVQDLVAGDRIWCEMPTNTSDATRAIGMEMRVAAVAGADQSGRCDVGSREVFFGNYPDADGLDNGEGIYGVAWGNPFDNEGSTTTPGQYCYHPDPSEWDGYLEITNVTIESQDYWGEAGGDCDANAGASQYETWIFGDGEGVDDDDDCDTNYFVIANGGRTKLHNVVIKNWHAYSIDGGVSPGKVFLGPDITWLYGRGEGIFDGGQGWRVDDFEVAHSVFNNSGNVMAFIGNSHTIRRGRIHNVYGGNAITLVDNFGFDIYDLRIESVRLSTGVRMECGNKGNRIERVYISGRDGGHDKAPLASNGASALFMDCDDAANPITMNRFVDWYETAPSSHRHTQPTRSRMVAFMENSDAGIFGNHFEGFKQDTDHADSVLFSVRAVTPDQAEIDTLNIANQNSFVGNYTANGILFGYTSGSNGVPGSPALTTEVVMNGAANLTGASRAKIDGGTRAFYAADSGGDAAEGTLTQDNYDVTPLSLTETEDRLGCFTTTANEVCYSCAEIKTFQITSSISFGRTTGAGTDIVKIAFGKDTTGAIDDGDEFGDEFQRTIAALSVIGMGALSATTELEEDDCVSMMWQANNGSKGYTMNAASVHIVEQ